MLIERCEANPAINLHLMITSNPDLDDQIVGEPASYAQAVRGFSGPSAFQAMPIARIWLPQLGRGRVETLRKIRATHDSVYKVCPVVPFPARNTRRGDELLSEYQAALVEEWKVDARDYIYVSEKNPLDCYRNVSTLKKRYDKTVDEVFFPQIILSPLGSRVIAAGAMMAAIEHDLSVHYVETSALRVQSIGVERATATEGYDRAYLAARSGLCGVPRVWNQRCRVGGVLPET